MKAAGYLRTAAVGQEAPELGRAAVQAYADAHGLEVVAWYTDAAVSGLVPLEDRPAGSALLQGAAAREFDLVLVLRGDRVGRSASVVTAAITGLVAVGVKLESVTEGEMR